jgi:pyruvate dehydrogenase E2 component (dihydrolipoamide acetyltransferase)
MRQLQDLVARAPVRSAPGCGSTITVSELDDQGVDAAFGIIYPPQVALGSGRIAERPWIGPERIEARPLLTATLSADHRATDGHRGGMFLTAIDRLLQTPGSL